MANTIEELKAEIAEKENELRILKEMEDMKDEFRERIHSIIDRCPFTMEELFPEFNPQKIKQMQRHRGTPKFRGPSGQTYDGRSARRADEFTDFVVDDALDVQAIADAGLLNVDWMRKKKNASLLVGLGIRDIDEYIKMHNLKHIAEQ